MRGAGSHCILGCAGKFLESTKVSRAHLLSLGSVVCILTLVLRTVFSRVRGEHGAVEKALKNILLTICTVLMTPVVVVLSFCWRSTPIATVEVLFQPRLQAVESTSPLSRSKGYATCTSARIVRQWCVCQVARTFSEEGLERTTKELAASAPSAMKIKVVAPPDFGATTLPLCGSVVPAASRSILTMHASLAFFVRQVDCLAMCRMRSLGGTMRNPTTNQE